MFASPILFPFFNTLCLLKCFKANSKYHVFSPLYTLEYISEFVGILKFHCNAIITREGDTLILGSDKTVMPDDVKAIGSYAFYNCKNLKTITIPSSVSYIGEVAFKQSGLETVTIPATVKCIAGGAFSECKDLKSMLIESPATNMTCGSYDVLGAITDCPNLTISLATTSLKIESGKYTIETWSWEDGSSSGDAVYRFIVPCGTAESFKNSDWGKMFEFRDDCDQKPEPEE